MVEEKVNGYKQVSRYYIPFSKIKSSFVEFISITYDMEEEKF